MVSVAGMHGKHFAVLLTRGGEKLRVRMCLELLRINYIVASCVVWFWVFRSLLLVWFALQLIPGICRVMGYVLAGGAIAKRQTRETWRSCYQQAEVSLDLTEKGWSSVPSPKLALTAVQLLGLGEG